MTPFLMSANALACDEGKTLAASVFSIVSPIPIGPRPVLVPVQLTSGFQLEPSEFRVRSRSPGRRFNAGGRFEIDEGRPVRCPDRPRMTCRFADHFKVRR